MAMSLKRGAAAWVCASLAGALMASASTAALAAPKHRHAVAKPDVRDARLEALTREVEELKAQVSAMQGQSQAAQSSAAQVAAVQRELADTKAQLAEVKTVQTATVADIDT